jgi:hypothetical protein
LDYSSRQFGCCPILIVKRENVNWSEQCACAAPEGWSASAVHLHRAAHPFVWSSLVPAEQRGRPRGAALACTNAPSTHLPLESHKRKWVLVQGLEAGAHRQLIFTGLRIGLYGNLLDHLSGEADREKASLTARIGAALTTSAIGITAANPSDVVKVRTQASSKPASTQLARAPQASQATTRAHMTGAGPQSMLCKPSGSQESMHASSGQRTLATRAAILPPPGSCRAPTRSHITGLGGQRRLATGAVSTPLYEGPAYRVYQHIIRTEGVFGVALVLIFLLTVVKTQGRGI